MKPIIHTPHKALTSPSKEIHDVDKKIHKIIADMKDTLEKADNPKGVGLAAPQIGLNVRIFLIREQEDDPISVYINPAFVSKSDEIVIGIPGGKDRLEGCLSVPKVWGIVTRHKEVTLSFLDEKGEPQKEHFKGFRSIIAQHEMDHLDGVLFTRRVIEQKGKLYKAGINEEGEEVLELLKI